MAVACLLLSGTAQATPILDFVFTATTGAGQPGGATIAAAPGDLVTVELRLTAGPEGVSSYAVSVEFDRDLRDELDLVSVEEILPVGFAFAFTPGELARRVDSSPTRMGRLYTFEAATLGLGPVSRTLTIGRIGFRAREILSDGPDLEAGFFHSGVDGLFDNGGQDIAADASRGTAAVDSIPEPSPLVLVAFAVYTSWRRSVRRTHRRGRFDPPRHRRWLTRWPRARRSLPTPRKPGSRSRRHAERSSRPRPRRDVGASRTWSVSC